MSDEAPDVLSRVAFATHGSYYLLLSLLVALLLRGGGGDEANAGGAFDAVVRQPLGRGVLALVCVGIGAYAWHGVRDAWSGDDRLHRVSAAARGIVWAGLGLLAARSVVTGGGEGGGGDEASMTATVLAWPAGALLVGAVGVIILGVGARHAYRAFSGELGEELGQLDLGERRAARVLGGAGHLGRGLAFGVVGGFVIVAAVQHDPESSAGLDGALQKLMDQPFGPWVVALVAVGFCAFGLFRLVEARYRF